MPLFGHHANGHQSGPDAGESLTQAVELARRADAIGVNGAYFRVHHFAPQHSSPMSLLGAVAGATENLEVGTGVINMRYENPLHLAEEADTLDLVSRGRVALGVSRGSPEPARRDWEAFGYTAEAPDGRDMARQKFLRLLTAAHGEAMAVSDTLENQYPQIYHPGVGLPVFPQSPTLRRHIWWGAGSHATAEQAAHDGVNLMSSTLVSEADDSSLGDLQAEQIERYRTAWKAAGHPWTPRVSVTFGGTYAAEPDKLIEQLRADSAVMARTPSCSPSPTRWAGRSTPRSWRTSPATSPASSAGSRAPRPPT